MGGAVLDAGLLDPHIELHRDGVDSHGVLLSLSAPGLQRDSVLRGGAARNHRLGQVAAVLVQVREHRAEFAGLVQTRNGLALAQAKAICPCPPPPPNPK